jgi:DNA-binding response OmpR family regulator
MANKVLVVDDEASLVELCRIILENAGYNVRGAINGREANRSIHEVMPYLVLLDVMIPGMDVIEV